MRKELFIWTLVLSLISLVVLSAYFLLFFDKELNPLILKSSGILGAILGIIGVSVAGYLSGKDYDTYTGWERYTHGAGMFFNREPFRKEKATYIIEGPTSRMHWLETWNGQVTMAYDLWEPPDGSEPKWSPDMDTKAGIEAFPEPLKSYFRDNPDSYIQSTKAFKVMDKQKEDWKKYGSQYAVADAWSVACASSYEAEPGVNLPPDQQYPPEPVGPPEESDFRGITRSEPLSFKSSKHASDLIKKITHTFGATLVGITKLNPDWCFQGHLRGVGLTDYEIPSHWEYAIVYAVPMEWDQMVSNPTYGTSFDAYSNARIIGGRLECFVRELGYPARFHVPPDHYDLNTPAIAVDAGLGEQGRNSLCISPELGSNTRLGVVTTSIPMEVDKPIDFGVKEFCKKCKICADSCPTGALSYKEKPDVHYGYRRWRVNSGACYQGWASIAQPYASGCRICLSVCPYTRKNNWLHAASRYVDPRDPTGITSSLLLWMQKTLFKVPNRKDFLLPPKGKNASYRLPPDWLQAEKWFDINNKG
jgi:epoxyqueuosine reductase